ncbi:MAG: hypothetical protein E7305_11135 [Butyrivibrio sp.]|nr:hypothetical protein [Butyrivibrio sp.]
MDIKKKRLLIAAISMIIWAACVYFGYVSYDVNDDAGMNMVAAGAYGPITHNLVHMNVVHGYVLKVLYAIFPFVNCYLWSFLVCDLLAVMGFAMVVTDKLRTYPAVVITVAINLILASDFYVHIQFTKSSALYVSVGLVMLIWQMKKTVREKSMLALSYFFIILGLSIRWESFLLALPVVLGALIVDELYELVIKKNKIDFKKYTLTIIPIAVCIVIALINHVSNSADPGWAEFRKTEEVLSPMRDFNRYVYSDSPEEYQAAGFTETDFEMVKGYWMWDDTEQFNSERLCALADIGEKYAKSYVRFDASYIKLTIKEVLSALTGKHIAMAFAVVLVLALLTADLNVILQMLYMIVVSMGEIYYFFCLERVLWRAELCIWLTILMMGGYLVSRFAGKGKEQLSPQRDVPSRKYVLSYVAMAVCVLVLILVKSIVVDNSRFTNGDNRYDEFVELTKLEGVHFVCYNKAEYGVLQGADNIFAIDRRYAGYYENMSDLGGFAFAPFDQYYGVQKGITNPIRALFERDDVYYLGDEAPLQCLGQFISEKYGVDVDWEPVTFGQTTAWKCVTSN